MPAPLITVAAIAFPALMGASVLVLLVNSFMPAYAARLKRWDLFAAVVWLSALDLLVLSTVEGPVVRGLYVWGAAADAWWGWVFYRRWRDDEDEKRPRRKRRVLRLAKNAA